MNKQPSILLDPGSARFDPDDERWLQQVNAFVQELRDHTNSVSNRSTTVPNTKGTVESIIMSLGSAGALTASIEFFKAWLGRDKTRNIKVLFGDEGNLQSIELTSTSINDGTFDALTNELVERISRESREP